METDSSAIISIESDEEMDTVTEPEACASAQNEKEPANEAPDKAEHGAEPPKSADSVVNQEPAKEPDIICIDDEEKETAETSEGKSSENLSTAAPASEMIVSEPSTEMVENEDAEMKEITNDVEEKDCQPTDPQQAQSSEETETVEPMDTMNVDKKEDTAIETAVETCPKTEEPVLPFEAENEQKQQNSKRRVQKCANTACAKKGLEYCDAPVFAQNLYKIAPGKDSKAMCPDCFQYAVNHFETLCNAMLNGESLYARETLQDKMEEIHTVLDSSDEENDDPAESEPTEVEPALPAEVISMVDMNLNDVVQTLWEEYGSKQLTMYNADMMREAQINEERSNRIEAELKKLKSTLQTIHENIYSVRTTKVDTHELIIEDDVTTERIAYERMMKMLNRNEPLVREPVKVNEEYYGVWSTTLSNWYKCKVVEASDNQVYTVRFTEGETEQAVLSAKHLAYTTEPQVKLKLGTRIIAKVGSGVGEKSQSFFAGTVLESISAYNKFRYLIIFDYGVTLYAPMENVRVVCEQSKNIWDDVHPHSKEFIRNYMQTCDSLRPMVQAHRGQRLKVEINHKWYIGKVLETDSSLFQLYFQELNKYEWIYRGSTRLEPLFLKVLPSNKLSKFQRRNQPHIEYITIEDDENEPPVEKVSPPSSKQDVQDTQNRPTARKSTLQRISTGKPAHTNVPSVISLNNPIYVGFDKNLSHGKTVFYNTQKYRGPQKFVPHVCSPQCLYKMPSNLQSYNLLARPLVTGWERQFCHIRGTRKSTVVMYRAPCGRRLRDMQEVHRYLRVTDCSLNVENFDFETEIRALATFNAENYLFECKDLSFGAELMPVSCVNNYENQQPPPCEYSTERIPTEGVNLNLDKEFLCGCDCEDDCLDKSKCQCWQLTIAGAQYVNSKVDINDVGYVYKRLLNQLHTGVYECNVQCKCKKDKCLNRVVQNSLQMKLQVFKTHNKGWGIRCLNDVSMGSFICIYAGHLLTEEASTEICEMSENKTGDEYFADLDYIETAESTKANYESEAYRSENEASPPETEESEVELESERLAAEDDPDEEYTAKTVPSTMAVKTRAQSRKANTTERSSAAAPKQPGSIIGVNGEQECVSLIPNPEMEPEDNSGRNSESQIRRLYGKNEDEIYIMDAKKSGNLGRYFNHSCVPNLFVQNVFVDTHDLRFPWVAFFASTNIKAGTELTWNYNYDVGSVNGKVLTCTCGEKGCKGRLLSTSSSVSGRGINTGGIIFSVRSRKSHSRTIYCIGMRAKRHSQSASIFAICASLSDEFWWFPTSDGPDSSSTCAIMLTMDVSGSGMLSDSNRLIHFSCVPRTVAGNGVCAIAEPALPL
uniref:Histone-lysine N-methyltransferase eggless n=1 Tax=Anopheles culicifacies TaxID=139723 RepID=A0A182M0Q0_9DIPT